MSFFSFLILTACIESPILHHADADTVTPQAQTEADCPLHFPTAGLCASITWDQMQTEDEPGSFKLKFWDAKTATSDGPYLTPENAVFTRLMMPSMGHGSSPVKTEQLQAADGSLVAGVYHATGVYFSMPGHWEIWIQLRRDRGVLEQAKVDITI
ncbi:MAG: hypothetical protein H7301_12505 [Cryobacterium sp.]|nr:hypothetical protein [Oligoflexia bacterium]